MDTPSSKQMARVPITKLEAVSDALSDMIDLADAWASCGPEGYTRDERSRRNRAERLLRWLGERIAKEHA